MLDDGSPAIWALDYDAGSGAKLTGKLPVGLDVAAIARATGLPAIADESRKALIGAGGDASLLKGLARWLPAFETLKATVSPAGAEIVAGVGPGSDAELLSAALAADLEAASGGKPVSVSVVDAPPAGSDGETRANALTGLAEVFQGGYWLPVLEITPSVEACTTAANNILAGETINFLSGSDRLDASGRGVINRLASVLLPCTRERALKAVIGGHTDSTGDAELNLGLSQRRAVAVRKALIERGIPGTALRAQGYGASQPIASNDSEEGKAANRRTTIEWSE